MNENRIKRTYRLIKLIQDIKTVPYQPIEKLLQTFGISRAQFYKDKNELAALGFEFFYDRSKARFVITNDPYLPVENLSLSERISLMMAVRQLSAAGDYILSFEGLNAARKLAADLPLSMRDYALSLFDDVVLKEGFGCQREILEKVQHAVNDSRRVMLLYLKPEEESPVKVELDPYHLFFRRRALYVEGFSVAEKDIRMYRLNRVKQVSYTPLQFTVPTEYNFGLRHKNAFSAFPGEKTEHVVVRFSKTVRSFIEESLWHHSQVIKRERNGTILFHVDVAEPREVMWWAFQWGAEAEILEPEWLREVAKRTVEGMVSNYRRKDGR